MMKLKSLLCYFCLFLLGCSGAKQTVLEKNLHYPKSTRAGIPYVLSETDLRCTAWWEKLNDPKLNELITVALAANDQINSAKATIAEAKAQLKAAQFAWIPTLDASANGFSARAWGTDLTPLGPLAGQPTLTHRSQIKFRGYAGGFVPGYTVNILNNLSNIKAAKATLAMKHALKLSVKLTIISQMSGAYFMLLSQREQLSLEKTLCAKLKQLGQLEQIRFKKGVSNLAESINIDQELAAEEAKLPALENVIAQSENTIQRLLNQNPGPVQTKARLASLNLTTLMPKNLPSSVLKNRPDILLAIHNMQMADANLGLAYSAFFPTISLTGLLGKTSLDLRHLLKLSTNIWLTKAMAATKLLNLSAYQNIKAMKASISASYHDYLHTVHEALMEVDNALTQAQKTKTAYLHTKKAYQAAKKAHTLVLSQYKAGAIDYRPVLHATINLQRQQLSLVQEKAQLLDSYVQVYEVLAGGALN